jgi:hypothetical protein
MANLPVPQICAGLPAHTALQSDSVARRAGLTVILIRGVHEYAGEILTSITTIALELLVMMFSFQYWMTYLYIVFSSEVIVTSAVLGTHFECHGGVNQNVFRQRPFNVHQVLIASNIFECADGRRFKRVETP